MKERIKKLKSMFNTYKHFYKNNFLGRILYSLIFYCEGNT